MACRSVFLLVLLLGLTPGAAMAATWRCSIGTSLFARPHAEEFSALETARPGDRLYTVGAWRGLQFTIVVNDPLTLMAQADSTISGPGGKLRVYSETVSIKKRSGYLSDVVTTYGPHASARVETARGFCRYAP